MPSSIKDMYKKLTESDLTKTDAKKLGLKFIQKTEAKKISKKNLAGFVIPYYTLAGKKTSFWRLRFLDQPGKSFGKQRDQRYTQTPDTVPSFYLPPILEPSWLKVAADTKHAIYITEGELKAACACKIGLPTIGLGGVYNWKSKKKNLPTIGDFKLFDWRDRTVCIIFDSDASRNVRVQAASYELAKVFVDLGAYVYIADLPDVDELEKTGLDDFIVARGKDELLDVVSGAEPFSLCQELYRLNTEVAYVRDPGIVVKLSGGQKMRPEAFTGHAYANRFYYVKDKDDKIVQKPAASAWLKWSQRLEIESLTYAPGHDSITDDNKYNSWSGWGCEPKRGTIEPWRQLLDYIFKDAVESRRWFEKWCAIQVQQPGIKLYSYVLVWGVTTGTGKSLIGITLGKIFGDNFTEIDQTHLHSAFNDWCENKQFILGDEITGSDKRQEADKIKNLTTRTKIRVNTKHMPVYSIIDCINYYFTSNHPDAMILEDQDRRAFVHEVKQPPLTDSFYAKFDVWLHGNGPSYLFYYLQRLKLDDFNPKSRPPHTKARQEMILDGKSDLASWVWRLMNNPVEILCVDQVTLECDLWTAAQLLHLYDPEKKTRVTAGGLGRELKRAGLTKLQSVRIKTSVYNFYAVKNFDKWEKARPAAIIQHYQEHFGDKTKKY